MSVDRALLLMERAGFLFVFGVMVALEAGFVLAH